MRHSIEAKIQRCIAHFERHYGKRDEMEAKLLDNNEVVVRDLQTRECAYYDIAWWRIRKIKPPHPAGDWREVEKKETAG